MNLKFHLKKQKKNAFIHLSNGEEVRFGSIRKS